MSIRDRASPTGTNGTINIVHNSPNTGGVDLTSGDPINVVLSFNSQTQTLTEYLSDQVADDSFTTTYTGINLPAILGSNSAYMGFTGATGGADSVQTITGFSYFALPAQQVNLSGYSNGYGIGLNGSATIGGGYDGSGNALSGTLIGNAQAVAGATPPQTFLFGAGNTLNTITASGQTITLPQGNDGNISLVGSAVNGSQPGQTITVHYTNGTSTSFTQGFSDWHSPQNYAGEVTADSMSYDLTSTGAEHHCDGHLRLHASDQSGPDGSEHHAAQQQQGEDPGDQRQCRSGGEQRDPQQRPRGRRDDSDHHRQRVHRSHRGGLWLHSCQQLLGL